MYKHDTVYQGYGTDTETYQAWSKKGYIFWLLAEASVAITFMAYFLCVVLKYVGKYKDYEEKGFKSYAKEHPSEEDKKKADAEAKKEGEKKD